MPEAILPPAFGDLERWAAWSLETEEERSHKRLETPMEELQAIYDTLLPRADEALAYLDKFPIDELPRDAERLLWLLFSLAEVAPAIEQFGQPEVVDGYDLRRFTAERQG